MRTLHIIRLLTPRFIDKFLEYFSLVLNLDVKPLRALQIALSRSCVSKLSDRSFFSLPPHFLDANPVIVDVGAHSGEYIDAVHVVRPNASIIAIEPNVDLCDVMAKKYGKRVRVICGIASNKNEDAEIIVTDDFASWSMLEPISSMNSNYGWGFSKVRKQSVSAKTLDSMCSEFSRISLLKIDAQGFEREVLEGAEEVLSKTDCILIEVTYYGHYENDISFWDIHKLMLLKGFILYDLKNPFRVNSVALWSDAIYIRKNSSQRVSISQ